MVSLPLFRPNFGRVGHLTSTPSRAVGQGNRHPDHPVESMGSWDENLSGLVYSIKGSELQAYFYPEYRSVERPNTLLVSLGWNLGVLFVLDLKARSGRGSGGGRCHDGMVSHG